MPKIKKLPSGNFNAKVYDRNLKTTRSFTASTKDEVKRMVAEFEHNMDAVISGDYTIKQAMQIYIDNRSSVLSPSTLRGYRQLQHYYEPINNYYVSTITSEDIQKFINDIAIDHSPKTVRNVYGLLFATIKAINPSKGINISLPQKNVLNRKIPTNKDIKNLIDNSSGYLRISILLASTGTMRRGEIAALMYEDINGNVIHVHSDMVQGENRQWIIKDIPKTSSSDRYIEYPQAVIDEIGTGKGRIMDVTPNAITQAFIKLRKKVGVDCRFHDLRHYAASIMHAIGIPDQYIMEVGGWSSDTILKSVYRNILDDKRDEFNDKRNEYMSKLL